MTNRPAKKPARKKEVNSGHVKGVTASFIKGEVFSLEEKLEEKVSMRFKYWRGWMLFDLSSDKGTIFPNTDREYVNRLKEKVLSGGNPETLPKLLEIAPWTIRDGTIAEKVYKLQYRKPIKLRKIGGTRGRTDTAKLRMVIEKDINGFKELVLKRIGGKTVQDITKDATDQLVWRRYIKPARVILKAVGGDEHSEDGWEDVFKCFETMGALVYHEHPYVVVTVREEDPKILLVKTDMTIKNGLHIYHT